MKGAYALLFGSPQQKHHFAYTEAGASARGNVYASVQKALSESMILRIQILGHLQEVMYTLLCRSLQQKHHFAYTEAGASARGDVYASAQKPAAKTSFCVYRSRRVCEGQCVRICAESFSENIILRIQKPARLRGAMYTLLRRKLQRKHHFAYTEAEASARGALYAFA